MITVNDIVTVKREFAESEEDEKVRYKVLELRGDRVLLMEADTALTIAPTFVFALDWIEPKQ